MSQSFTKKLLNFSFQEDLWQKGSRLVVGVSGGPDSVCLLHFLANLVPKYDLTLVIAHINYGLRGKDSLEDELFVKKLAQKYSLPVFLLKKNFRKTPGENELRRIRYAFFEKIRKAQDLEMIAVGHNQDDQAETFLFNLMRGAGLRGLSGMKAKNGRVIRPLLQTGREEILKHLRENQWLFRIDKTNTATVFTRNKIRHQLIPFLEKKFNPRIRKTLAENMAHIAADDCFLEEQARQYFIRKYHGSVSKLLSLDEALRSRVLFLALKKLKGSPENITFSQVREILKALQSAKSKNQKLSFPGLKLIRKGDRVILSLVK